MKAKHSDLEIHEDDPFCNCKLERKQYAVILTNIIQNLKDGFVLAIDNEWGTGKTTFVKMWRQYLKNEDYGTLYYNAWENDFENEVIVALISELKELKTSNNDSQFKKIINNASHIAKGLACGFIKTKMAEYVGDEATKEAASVFLDYPSDLNDKIEEYLKRKKHIEEFKTDLQNFVALTDKNKPVVFFIDEIDRCRPSYAVELLERIKHLFSVPGIVFVLSIDKIQLGHAICGFYGSDNINWEEYLRRFIDIEYSLPKPKVGNFCKYLYDYFQFDQFIMNSERINYNELKNDKSSLIDFSSMLFEYGNLSLREQEKILAHTRIAIEEFKQNSYIFPGLFILLIYIKIKHKTLYDNINNHKYSLQELVSEIENIILNEISKDDIRTILFTEALLVIMYNNSRHYTKQERILSDSENENEVTILIKSRLDTSKDNNDFKSCFHYYGSTRYDDLKLDYLVKKISLINIGHGD